MRKIKNLRRNALTLGTIVLSFGFTTGIAAQTGQTKKTNVTTKKAEATKTSKLAAKQSSAKTSAAKSAVKTMVKPVSAVKENDQIIVSAAFARIRKEPDTAAETLQTATLGAVYTLLEQNNDWYKIAVSKSGAEESGWISKTIARNFTQAKRGEIYLSIIDKYASQTSLDFRTAAQVFDFTTAALKEVKDSKQRADLSFKRLVALSAALKKVSLDKQAENPYKDFLKANEKEIVYSEPSGEWLVRGELFWELREKYEILPIAEEIAWKAAQNPVPGECEGYINCYLYMLRATDGEYLNFYPNGKYSRQALKNITNFLAPIVADSKEKTVYFSASDISDRADFNRYLTELRAIVSKLPHTEKSKTLQQIRQIAEAHR